jgi:hypothetical protein
MEVTEFAGTATSVTVVTTEGGLSIGIMFATCIARCTTDSFDVDVAAVDAVVFGAISLTLAVDGIVDGLEAGTVKWPCPGSVAVVFTRRG